MTFDDRAIQIFLSLIYYLFAFYHYRLALFTMAVLNNLINSLCCSRNKFRNHSTIFSIFGLIVSIEMDLQREKYILLIGSNVGNKEKNLRHGRFSLEFRKLADNFHLFCICRCGGKSHFKAFAIYVYVIKKKRPILSSTVLVLLARIVR